MSRNTSFLFWAKLQSGGVGCACGSDSPGGGGLGEDKDTQMETCDGFFYEVTLFSEPFGGLQKAYLFLHQIILEK